mgnify:FL=1
MRRTVWTLLFALLLQWFTGGAWALSARQAPDLAVHCHEVLVVNDASATHASPTDSTHAHSGQSDSHHCCAIGLGVGVQAQLLPLPQTLPNSPHGPWASLSLRPDLRPPI